MHPKSKVMNFKEKIKLAEQGVKYLYKGKSLKDYKDKLKQDGFYGYDINNIVSSIKNILSEKYGEEFKTLLEADQLEAKRENYPFLDDEIFDFIKEKEIKRIRYGKKREIRKLLYEGYIDIEVAKAVQNKYFTLENAISYIKEYKSRNEVVSKKEKSDYVFIGILLVIAAVVLAITTTRLFYGAIIVGIGMIIIGASDINEQY